MEGKLLMNLFNTDEVLEDVEDSEYLDSEYISTTFPELCEHDMWQGENY